MTERSPDERIARLETLVESIHAEFGEVRSTLALIQQTLAKGRETNWSVIFAGIAICGGLYSSAIRPIEHDLERQSKASEQCIKSDVLRDSGISDIKNTQVAIGSRLAHLESMVHEIKGEGSPITDKRLTLLEFRLKDVKR